MFKNKRYFIFDFDGTIADTYHLHETAFRETLKDYPVEFEYKDYAGMSTREATRQIFSMNEVLINEKEFDFLVKRKQQRANQLYKECIAFVPGAFSFIELLNKEKGIRLCLASSGSRMNVMDGLRALEIEKYFDYIVTGDDVQKAKPDPEIFQLVLRQAGVEANNAIVIEDSISGIMAADAAGIDVICIDKDITGEEDHSIKYLVFDFFELSQLYVKECGTN